MSSQTDEQTEAFPPQAGMSAPPNGANAIPTWARILGPGLALSIGWGIRGNFGHEIGAWLPGALAALAAIILSGRNDWLARAGYFGMLGAIGWGFGGSISYMMVIGYTHSGYWDSQLYGFAMLFVIGFLWGSVGGAGTALPALLDRKRLAEIVLPVILIWCAFWIRDIIEEDYLNVWAGHLIGQSFISKGSDFRQDEPLYWLDTDWVSVLIAMAVVGILALVRRRLCFGSRLVLWMAAGWWIGFLLLPNLLGLRMTPPRGDSWAGNLGMVGGLMVFFARNRIDGANFALLVSGFIGGLGFASGQMLKLIELKIGHSFNPPLAFNSHSVLEQSYGFINGIGIAVTMLLLSKRAPKPIEATDEPRTARWTLDFATLFTVLGVAFLNLRQNPEQWVKQKVMEEHLYYFQPVTWYYSVWALVAIAAILLIRRHRREPIPLIPPTLLGKTQLMLMIPLWLMVTGNFERALGKFAEARLITEWVITLNAIALTLVALFYARECSRSVTATERLGDTAGDSGEQVVTSNGFADWTKKAVVYGTVFGALSILVNFGVARALFGNTPAPHAGKNIRFGPDNTTAPPKKGQAHP